MPQPDQPALDLPELLLAESVVTHFQTLASMRGQAILGVEALTRGVEPRTGRTIPPQALFDLAKSDELLIALDRLCRKHALRSFQALESDHPGLLLSLNFEAGLLDRGVGGSGHLLGTVRELGLDPAGIIIEIVESKVRDVAALERFVEDHKAHGFLVALDDVGSGHSNLERIAILKPDVLKIDRSLISGLDRHYHKQEVTRALLNMAGKIGALVVAEGVESEEEALAALEMGVDVLQGFYLDRPGPGLAGMDRAQELTAHLAGRFRRHIVEKIAAKKDRHRIFDQIMRGMVASLEGAGEEGLDQRLAELVRMHPWLECVYVLDEGGQQVSQTVCEASRLDSKRRAIFWPAARGSDQSLKNYFLLLKAGLERYVSEPYISLASGNLCITISTWFRAANGRRLVLCGDFDAEPLETGLSNGLATSLGRARR